MSHDTLATALFQRPRFQAELANARTFAVAHLLQGPRVTLATPPTQVNWSWLINCATLLSQAASPHQRTAALSIAQSCLLSPTVEVAIRSRAAIVLKALANEPAFALALRKTPNADDFFARIPFQVELGLTRVELGHTVTLSNDRRFVGNSFQRELWSALETLDVISATAPTSVGKSYLVERWICELALNQAAFRIIFIVPTRALVSQVERDIAAALAENGVDDVSIVTLPFQLQSHFPGRVVFVMTQERLLLVSGSEDGLEGVSAVIIDEAQKLGDGARGILLQTALDRLSKASPSAKILFLSPFAANPGDLLDAVSIGRRETGIIRSDTTTVDQYLFWVDEAGANPKKWNIKWVTESGAVEAGHLSLASVPSTQLKRLALVAHAIAQDSPGNILYVNGAADAEKIGQLVYDSLIETEQLSDDITALIDVCRKSVHSEFMLAKFLRRGVAFHYGSMPQVIRQEIERLFTAGKISYLVCTSTLVEGVNTSCKRLFLRGPQRGKRRPMTPDDFWNLAGRAGRWGKEFAGEIYCVDAAVPNLWFGGAPPVARAAIAITTSLQRSASKADALIAYISAGAPDNFPDRADVESATAYLVDRRLQDGTTDSATLLKNLDADGAHALDQCIEAAVSRLFPLTTIIHRNPGINPFAMDRFVSYLGRRSGEDSELIPPQPASENAVNAFIAVFRRMYRELGAAQFGPSSKQPVKAALLVVDWMRGYPVPRLIESRRAALERKGQREKISKTIRDVLKDVDEIARFYAPKYLACYIDLVRLHLERAGKTELIEQLADYSIYLELGVSTKTQLSLMALGLSRTAASELFERMVRDDMSATECLEWLRTNDNWRQFVPRLIEAEIDRVLPLS